MDDERDAALRALLLAERVAYARRARLRGSEIQACLRDGRIEDARHAAHKMCGSAGTYGFPGLGEIAREVCDALDHSDTVDGTLLDRLLVECEAVEKSMEAIQ